MLISFINISLVTEKKKKPFFFFFSSPLAINASDITNTTSMAISGVLVCVRCYLIKNISVEMFKFNILFLCFLIAQFPISQWCYPLS